MQKKKKFKTETGLALTPFLLTIYKKIKIPTYWFNLSMGI